MARGLIRVRRGEIWLYEFKAPDKRRPVLVLSRQETLAVIHTAIVAPISSRIRELPSEVVVGIDEGLRHDSAINLDNIRTVEQWRLRGFVGSLGEEKLQQVCRALGVATGCAFAAA